MLWDLVNLIVGGLPEEYNFIKIYCVFFILLIFFYLIKLFLDVLKSLLRWF